MKAYMPFLRRVVLTSASGIGHSGSVKMASILEDCCSSHELLSMGICTPSSLTTSAGVVLNAEHTVLI
jgi:hypothetical protein